MVWTVTLEIVDCASSANKLAGASVFDSANTWYTDANGQLIYVVDNSLVGVIVRISHGVTASAPNGYIQKNYTIAVQNAGTIQTICLSAAPPSDPTGAGCFTADTLVTLADGSQKAIARVRVGDHLLGRGSQPNRVSFIHLPRLGNRKLYALNGGTPFVTGEHPFMTGRGWKTFERNEQAPAGDAPRIVGRLALQDMLLRLQGCAVAVGAADDEDMLEAQVEQQPLLQIEGRHASPQTQLYNLRLDGDHSYFANGWLVHNKSTGGCFIVSATTGSSESVEVNRLRALRNRVAAQSGLADQLIELIYQDYFEFSPAIAAELEQDSLAQKVVLWTVVRPLLAWYSLAAVLALEPDNQAAVEEAVRVLREACPQELGDTPALGLLQALVTGRALPENSPELLREFAPSIRRAAGLRFASWAILDPLTRLWRSVSAAAPMDVCEEVAQWLSSAPLEAVRLPEDPALREMELAALACLFEFCPAERWQLGERLASAWPQACAALAQAGFVRQAAPTFKEN